MNEQWWDRYSDLDRFLVEHREVVRTRYYVIDGLLEGERPYVVCVGLDPYEIQGHGLKGAVLSHEEMQTDPNARPLLEAWLRGDDSQAWLSVDDDIVASAAEDILHGLGND